jgi:oligosaccharide reducing-end xylanase
MLKTSLHRMSTPGVCLRLIGFSMALATTACVPLGTTARTSGDDVGWIQAESMTRRGGKPLAPSFKLEDPDTAFPGVLLYGNQDQIGSNFRFDRPGRWRFRVRGASSDSTPTGFTVFIDGKASGTAFFTDRKTQVQEVLVDIEEPGERPIAIGVTTDIGRNDTLLDAIAIDWASDLMPPPAPPAMGAAESGTYRNMFAERGHAQADIDAKLERTFNQLFHGDPNEETVFYSVGKNKNGELAYVTDVGSDDVRSEGMSYGMMIAVQLDKKAEFDALWNWAVTYMRHADPKHPASGYFAWSMNKSGTARDDMPAPDGEEYFAMSLYFAAARWGEGKGIYAYKAEADRLLDVIKNRPVITGKLGNGRTTSCSPLFNGETKQVRFTPDHGYFESEGDHTDPSYHLPAFYELWAKWGPVKDRAFWKDAAKVSRDLFVKAANAQTGLVPDYAEFDGRPRARKVDPTSGNFRYDAWRASMNWSVDQAWWAADPRQQELSNRLQAFFDAQGIATHGNTFTLDGKQVGKDHSQGLVAMNAVASMAATHPRAWRFVDELWSLEVSRGRWRYYDGMLHLLGLLHVSGRFQIWEKKTN